MSLILRRLFHPRRRLEPTTMDRSDPVLRHTGPYRSVLRRHQRQCGRYFDDALSASPGAWLFGRIADTRSLRHGLDDVVVRSPNTPGVDGIPPVDLLRLGGFDALRRLGQELVNGSFEASEPKFVTLPKPGGGTRTIAIGTARDRTVARSLHNILRPWFTPCLGPYSFSFAGHLHALASFVARATAINAPVAIVADQSKAFDNVPLVRLYQTLQGKVDDDTLKLIRALHAPQGRPRLRGLPQGCPASNLLFDLFQSTFLDRPFHARHPEELLIRYVDDLAVPLGSRYSAEGVARSLIDLTNSAGVPLSPDDRRVDRLVVDLRDGGDYLGYHLRRDRRGLRITMSEDSWGGFAESLERAHGHIETVSIAKFAINDWIQRLGPAFPTVNKRQLAARTSRELNRLHFGELATAGELMSRLNLSARNWTERIRRAAPTPDALREAWLKADRHRARTTTEPPFAVATRDCRRNVAASGDTIVGAVEVPWN